MTNSSTARSSTSAGGATRRQRTVLLDAYRTIAKAISEGHAITPAAQWLIDNYHVVESR